MSVVVGLVHEGHVYMAADTRAMEGLNYSSAHKLFPDRHKQWGAWAIGGAGTMQNIAIAAEFDLPSTRRKGATFDIGVVRAFFKSVQAEIKERGAGENNGSENAFLLAVSGRLFSVDQAFFVDEITTFHAIGTGAEFAKGCLWALQRHVATLDPEVMVKEAVRCAIAHNAGVGGDIDVVVI